MVMEKKQTDLTKLIGRDMLLHFTSGATVW